MHSTKEDNLLTINRINWYKIRYFIDNQPDQYNTNRSREKYNIKNNNQIYGILKPPSPPLYITNHQLQEIQQPHGSQMNEILNNIFSLWDPKSRKYSTKQIKQLA